MLEALIAAKTHGAPSRAVAWRQAATAWIGAGSTPEAFVQFAQPFSSPEALIGLARSLGREAGGQPSGPNAIQSFYTSVNDSQAPTGQWARSLEIAHGYLSARSRTASFSQLLGYVACSEEYRTTAGEPVSLSETVATFLENYGFEQ